LVRHLSLRHVVKYLARAMQWNDVIDVDLLKRRDRAVHVIVRVRGQVESTNDRMHFWHARCRLRLLDGVDHAAMAARGENYEATSFEVKGGSEFVLELVGNNRFSPLFLRQLARKAANPISETDLHGGRREHLLKAV